MRLPSSAMVVPLTFEPGLQIRERKLDQRRAGVGRQHVGLPADVEHGKGADRRRGFELAVGAVADLDAGAVIDLRERERDHAQLRGELLVRQAGHDDLAVGELQIGGHVLAALVGRRRVGNRGLRVHHVLERELAELARRVDANDHRLGVGALAARHGQKRAAGVGVDGQVVDQNVLGRGAQQRGDLLVDLFDVQAAGWGCPPTCRRWRWQRSWPPWCRRPAGCPAARTWPDRPTFNSGVPFFMPAVRSAARPVRNKRHPQ